MKTKHLCIASLATLISSSLYAGTMGPIVAPPSWAPVATLSIGPAWYGNDKARTFEIDNGIFKTFTGRNSNQAVFSGELFLGLHNTLSEQVIGEFGVALAGNTNMKFGGRVWDFANPEFENFDYSYNVNHMRVGLKGKLIGEFGYWVQPYVSAGVDAGFNQAKDFKLRTLIPEAVLFPRFQNQSTTTFAYTLGVGVQKGFADHWYLGVGYEYASLGTSQLGLAPAQTAGTSLRSNNLYTNELQFILSYVA